MIWNGFLLLFIFGLELVPLPVMAQSPECHGSDYEAALQAELKKTNSASAREFKKAKGFGLADDLAIELQVKPIFCKQWQSSQTKKTVGSGSSVNQTTTKSAAPATGSRVTSSPPSYGTYFDQIRQGTAPSGWEAYQKWAKGASDTELLDNLKKEYAKGRRGTTTFADFLNKIAGGFTLSPTSPAKENGTPTTNGRVSAQSSSLSSSQCNIYRRPDGKYKTLESGDLLDLKAEDDQRLNQALTFGRIFGQRLPSRVNWNGLREVEAFQLQWGKGDASENGKIYNRGQLCEHLRTQVCQSSPYKNMSLTDCAESYLKKLRSQWCGHRGEDKLPNDLVVGERNLGDIVELCGVEPPKYQPETVDLGVNVPNRHCASVEVKAKDFEFNGPEIALCERDEHTEDLLRKAACHEQAMEKRAKSIRNGGNQFTQSAALMSGDFLWSCWVGELICNDSLSPMTDAKSYAGMCAWHANRSGNGTVSGDKYWGHHHAHEHLWHQGDPKNFCTPPIPVREQFDPSADRSNFNNNKILFDQRLFFKDKERTQLTGIGQEKVILNRRDYYFLENSYYSALSHLNCMVPDKSDRKPDDPDWLNPDSLPPAWSKIIARQIAQDQLRLLSRNPQVDGAPSVGNCPGLKRARINGDVTTNYTLNFKKEFINRLRPYAKKGIKPDYRLLFEEARNEALKITCNNSNYAQLSANISNRSCAGSQNTGEKTSVQTKSTK